MQRLFAAFVLRFPWNLMGFIWCGFYDLDLQTNLYAPLVPCHRVVASNLTLGGFM
jgi:hypothetical protein